MLNNIYFSIIENVAILVAIAVLYDFIWLKYNKKREVLIQVILGLLLTGIGIILMKNPWTFVEGIVFDTRSVMLTISGLFFGGITTLIAMIGTSIFRFIIGGSGMYMGFAVIVSSSVISIVWRKLRPKIIEEKRLVEVYLVALVVHLAMLGCTFFLPGQIRIETLLAIFWPVLLIYPAATLLIALLLFQRQENWSNKKKLIESENLYRFIAERANDLIYVYRFKPQPGFEYVSPSATTITGYTPQEHYADPELGLKLVHPDDAHILKGYFKGKNFDHPVVLRWLKKDGSTMWTEQQNVPVYDENGELVALHGIARDITRRKVAEVKLKEREQTLTNLIDNLPGFIYRCANDPNWTMLYLSPAVTKITGYSPDDFINNQTLSFNDIILPKYRQYLWEKWQKVLANREKFADEYEIATKDGNTRWVWEQGKGIFDENGNLLYLEGYITDITDRKNAEKLVVNREHEFFEIFNATEEAILIYDFNTHKIVDCNQATSVMYGYTREELIGKPFGYLSSLNPPYTPDEAVKIAHKVIVKGPQTYAWQGKRKGGQLFWNEITLKAATIGDEKRFIAVVRDVTERISKQGRIQYLTKIIESSLNEIYVFRADNFKFIEVNQSALNNLGYRIDEIRELTPLDIKPQLTREQFDMLLKPLVERKQDKIYFETIHLRKNGTQYPVEVHLQMMDFEKNKVFVATIFDITERRDYQQKIAQREREFREIFNSTSEAILIYDTDSGKLVDCNQRAIEMYGYASKEELLSRNLLDLGANIEPYTNEHAGIYSQKARDEGTQRFDWLAKRKNGELFWVEVSLKRTKIGGVERDLTVVRDITERKKFEDDLTKAKEKAEESDRLKSAFLANLSHEIRTPMNAIMGFADLLKLPVDEKKRNEYIEIIQKSGFRLLDIITETIEIAKLDTGLIKTNPESFDLDQLMQDIYNELKIKVNTNKELELIYLPPSLNTKTVIYTDRVKLQQILINLITNGIKYTPRGAVAFGYEIKDNRVVFSVKDTGIGIDRKNKELVFKRFYRVDNPLTFKVGGIGLGLSIAKAYTELLGGSIELESELGRGTTVTVAIPYIKSEPQPEIFVEIPPEKLKGNDELILVAEDDEYNFLYINEILRQFNFNCLRAANGQEAVELAKKNENISLILMDLKMPILDGFGAFEQIKKLNPNIPIIAQTAYALGEDKAKIESYGFNGYISKPIKRNELLKMVKTSLKRT